MLRLTAIAFAYFALVSGSNACPIFTHSSIFYSADDVLAPPPDTEVIAEVTIILDVGSTDDGLQLGIAKVDKVIKGPIITGTVRITNALSDCNFLFAVGDHGIVMGKLRTNIRGEAELMATAEPARTKRLRRERNHINTRNG